RQRHVHYDLKDVVDLPTLWRALDRVASNPDLNPKFDGIYPLKASAREQDQALAKLPPEMRVQMEVFAELRDRMSGRPQVLDASPTLARHSLLGAALGLMSDRSQFDFSLE